MPKKSKHISPEESLNESSGITSAFEISLKEHLSRSNSSIAFPIHACVMIIKQKGIKEKEIFSESASKQDVEKFTNMLNKGLINCNLYHNSIHVVSGALKHYLRSLEDCIMLKSSYDAWLDVYNESGKEQKLNAVKKVLVSLPAENKRNLRFLMEFLKDVADHQDENQMKEENLAKIFSPTVLWCDNNKKMLFNIERAISVVSFLISNAYEVFSEEPVTPVLPPQSPHSQKKPVPAPRTVKPAAQTIKVEVGAAEPKCPPGTSEDRL